MEDTNKKIAEEERQEKERHRRTRHLRKKIAKKAAVHDPARNREVEAKEKMKMFK